ncbi:MAG: hypothetical protein QOC62_4808 [Mycobacterium sp.]|jgi:hypothetical protein|nr:hypothetical protein [Mycobacterium sp.]
MRFKFRATGDQKAAKTDRSFGQRCVVTGGSFAQSRHRCCTDRAPLRYIKSATVGEGQTPVTLSAVEDGLGEELRVLLAHSMRNGHHQLPRPGGMTRLDPVR